MPGVKKGEMGVDDINERIVQIEKLARDARKIVDSMNEHGIWSVKIGGESNRESAMGLLAV